VAENVTGVPSQIILLGFEDIDTVGVEVPVTEIPIEVEVDVERQVAFEVIVT
jgi:hypothetical protein